MRTLYWFLLSTLACASAGSGVTAGSPATAASAADAAVDAAPALLLEPGQVAELAVAADGTLGERLATPTGNERFVIVLASTRFEAEAAPVDYSLTLGAARRAGVSRIVSGCSLESDAWRGVTVSSEPVPSGEGPGLGSMRELNVTVGSSSSTIVGEVVSAGPHAVVIRDTTHPTSLDGPFAEQFRSDFENVILPRARQVFGTEPDLDGNGRISLVFSRLTREQGVAFFNACDLAGSFEGCAGSNAGEYLYLTPPDAIAPPYNTASAIKEILTHELSHLLHFNRKVLRNHLGAWGDSVYASEGIGALAQDVIGFQSGNLYVAKAGLDGIDLFSLADVLDRRRRPGVHDGISRGAAYLFIRYLYDRAGGDVAEGPSIVSRGGPAFLRALLDAPEPVAGALPRVAGASLADLALDFYTALALSNREDSGLSAPANACFSYLPTAKDPVTAKQRGTNVFAQFHGQGMTGPRVGAAASPDAELLPGGVEYLSLDAESGHDETAFSLRVTPAAAPRVRVARWK